MHCYQETKNITIDYGILMVNYILGRIRKSSNNI